MRYLFFDIECCDGAHICEFGYVVTDENFKVIGEQHVIKINPEKPFNLTDGNGKKVIDLYFTDDEYRQSPKFADVYNAIKELIEQPEQIIVGHSISNDAKFLRTACKRYSRRNIDFKFYDSQRMLSEFLDEHRSISLEQAGVLLDVEMPEHLHRSDNDSLVTMRIVQKMCQEMDVILPEFIELCPSCSGQMINGEITFDDSTLQEHERNFIVKKNFKLFRLFLENVKAKGTTIQSELTGKSICISSNYERYKFREMLTLVQLIVNHGGSYCLKASNCDLFVKFDSIGGNESNSDCNRKKHVDEAINNGGNIKIISWERLLAILKITEKDLSNAPFPSKGSFINKKTKKIKSQQFIDKPKITLADMLRSQGIDLQRQLNIKD